MLRKILLFSAFSIIPIELLSSDEFMQMQKFYYEQGYKEGAKKYYSKGIEDYQDHIIDNVIPKYKAKFEAIEATKYLLKENYITYPESYRQTYNDGTYKIVFTEPKVEKPINPEDLFRMPEKRISEVEKELDLKYDTNLDAIKEKRKTNSRKEGDYKNGLLVVDDLNSKEEIPNSVSSIKQETSLKLSKNKENLNMIEKLNLKYLDSFMGYTVYFKNNTEKAEFCYQISGDSSCSNLN